MGLARLLVLSVFHAEIPLLIIPQYNLVLPNFLQNELFVKCVILKVGLKVGRIDVDSTG